VWRWRAHGPTWHWKEQLPPLLLVSYLTASYGWIHDQVIFIPALIQVAVWILPNWRSQRSIWVSYLGASGLIALMRIFPIPDFFPVWHPLFLSLLYWVAQRRMARQAAYPARPA